MCNIDHPKFSCRISAKGVHGKDKAVLCDLCELWMHIKCNKLNYLNYRYLHNCDKSWYFIELFSTIFPFNSLFSNKSFLACCTNTGSNSTQWSDLENDHYSSLSLTTFFECLINTVTPENSNDPEKISLSKHYDIEEEVHNIEIPHTKKITIPIPYKCIFS